LVVVEVVDTMLEQLPQRQVVLVAVVAKAHQGRQRLLLRLVKVMQEALETQAPQITAGVAVAALKTLHR